MSSITLWTNLLAEKKNLHNNMKNSLYQNFGIKNNLPSFYPLKLMSLNRTSIRHNGSAAAVYLLLVEKNLLKLCDALIVNFKI